MPTQGKSSSVAVMPEFEGLKKWRVREPVADAKDGLRGDRGGAGEGDRPQPVVGVEQHRDRQAGDVGRQQEVDKVST